MTTDSNDHDHDRNHNGSDESHDHDLTQGENPGAQGDIGAGQASPGDDPVVSESAPTIEGDEQPRREERHDDGQGGDDDVVSPEI